MSKVTNSAALIFATKVFGSLLSMVSTIVLARILSPEDYGLIAIATVGITLTQSLLNIPVGDALLRLNNLTPRDFDTAFTISMIRSIVIVAIVFGLAWPTASLYEDERLTDVILALGCIIFLQGFRNPKFVLLAKNLNYSRELAIEVFARLLSLASAIWYAIVFKDYWALVIAPAVFGITTTLLSYSVYPHLPKITLEKRKEILGFTNWLTLTEIINAIGLRIDTLFLGLVVNMTGLGAYQLANDLVKRFVTDFIEPLAEPLFPQFAKKQQDTSTLSRQYLMSLQVMMTISIPISIGLALSAPKLVPVLLGEKWLEAILPIQVLAFVSAILTLSIPSRPISLALGRTRDLFSRQFIYLVVRLPVFGLAIFYFGILGALVAKAFLSVYFVILSLNMIKVMLAVSIKQQILTASRCYISTIIMALLYSLITILLTELNFSDTAILLIAVPIAAISYVSTHLLLWANAGRPAGSESILISFSKSLFSRLQPQGTR